jgi:hypothetical protein
VAILVVLVGVIFAGALVWAVLAAALRIALNLALAASIALLAALIVGALVAGASENQVPLTLLTMVALLVPTYLLLSRSRLAEPRLQKSQAPAIKSQNYVKRGRKWFRLWPNRQHADHSLHSTLEMLVEAAGSEVRVVRIQRSLLASAAAFAAARLDPDATDRLIVLRKRVPQLISLCLSRVETASAHHRVWLFEDLLDLLESVAADCERRRANLIPESDAAYLTLRRRIEDSLASSSLSPCN